MKKTNISKNWLFRGPGQKEYVTLDLPHDYLITSPRTPQEPYGAGNGYFPMEEGVYKKFMNFKSGQHVILDIDGAYMCAQVSMNECPLVMHPHGYAPILVDLTEHIRKNKINKLVIQTNALPSSSRWYPGAGIYRDVFVYIGGDKATGARIEPWDVFVTTPTTEDVRAEVQVSADKDTEAVLLVEIFDKFGQKAAEKQSKMQLTAHEKTTAKMKFRMENAFLWSQKTPDLYTIKCTLTVNGEIADTDERRFGIRTISADAHTGLLINGQPVKLRGGCIHHDHGALGAADYPAACRRKLTKLKEAGFNALRIAHNPPSEQLMEMCDEMGIIVMDEAFDMWNVEKGGHANYHLWFADWWQRDLTAMVLRDRNHPSVIAYSLGNEIPESGGTRDGACWIKKMAKEIRKLDDTRFVTSATYRMSAEASPEDAEEYREDYTQKYGHGIETWKDRTATYFAPLDICGYNYMYLHYEEDHERFPERVIWGSETHTVNFYRSWNKVLKYPYVLGDFTWTAIDNLGEVGTGRSLWAREGFVPGITTAPYPWRSCFQGDLDLCGYRRPQSYFREAIWLGNVQPKIFTTNPIHYGEGFSGTTWHWYDVHETWNFDDRFLGKPVKCEVYTDADEILWFLNDRKIGASVPKEAIATMDIPYERGTVTAVAYKNGQEVGRGSLSTVNPTARLAAVPDKTVLAADNRDLCYIEIAAEDDLGRTVTDDAREITCTVEGGTLLAVFSGNPKNFDQYGSNKCHLFEGRALAVIKAAEPGEVKVTLTGGCVRSDEILLEAK